METNKHSAAKERFDDNEAVVRRVMEEIVNNGNLDAIEDSFAPDYVDHNLPGEGPHRDELKRHHAMIRAAFPDWRTSGEYIPAEGDRVVYRGTNSGTHEGNFMGVPPTGKRYSVDEIHVYRVAGGKVAEHHGVVAMLSLMRQLDLIPPPGSAEKNKSVVRRSFELLNEKRLEDLGSLVHDDIVNHTAVPEKRNGVENYKAVMKWLLKAVPDQRWEIEDILAEDDKVMCRMTFSGTHKGDFIGVPPTGKSFSVKHIHVFRVTDGKLSEHWATRDDLGMMRQLGALPS